MLARTGIKDVAARAGVAVSSVSRVLAEHPDVSAEMRKRLLKAVRDIGRGIAAVDSDAAARWARSTVTAPRR